MCSWRYFRLVFTIRGPSKEIRHIGIATCKWLNLGPPRFLRRQQRIYAEQRWGEKSLTLAVFRVEIMFSWHAVHCVVWLPRSRRSQNLRHCLPICSRGSCHCFFETGSSKCTSSRARLVQWSIWHGYYIYTVVHEEYYRSWEVLRTSKDNVTIPVQNRVKRSRVSSC